MTIHKQTSHGSVSTILIALGAVLFVLAALVLSILAVTNDDKKDKNQSSPSTNQEITVEGEFVCLPHKDTDGPQTLECASGLKTDKDTYYGLQFDSIQNYPSGGERLRVTGTLKEDSSDIYRSEGNIAVESIEEL
jgi:hypothetical protein